MTALLPADGFLPNRSYTLARETPAIQVYSDENGRRRMGTLMRLPEGTNVSVCGEGFDHKTTKVCCESGFYYLFVEDLEPQVPLLARAAMAG
jgi:hypothetical protein